MTDGTVTEPSDEDLGLQFVRGEKCLLCGSTNTLSEFSNGEVGVTACDDCGAC